MFTEKELRDVHRFFDKLLAPQRLRASSNGARNVKLPPAEEPEPLMPKGALEPMVKEFFRGRAT